MNYYLWINGQEHGPYTLEQLQQFVDSGEVSPDQTARTEKGTGWKPLRQIASIQIDAANASPLTPSETETSMASAAVPPTVQTVSAGDRNHSEDVGELMADHLSMIRKHTRYPTLRKVIEISSFICFFLIIIGMISLLMKSQGGSAGFILFLMVCLVGLGAFLSFLVIAARESAFLFIDIGDSLLHEHSKNRVGSIKKP
jgi:hypothetical protein